MAAPQTPDAAGSARSPATAQPPLPFQIILRLAAAVAHVIFVAHLLRDYGVEAGFDALAPWAVLECLTVALIFGVPFLLLTRLAAAAGLSVFVGWAWVNFRADPRRITLLLMMLTEVITVMLVLIARPAGRQDWRPVAAFSTVAATFYFFALDFGVPERRLIPEWAGVTLQGAGLAWQIFAKLSLGRSFGLLPADRGIVTHGAYRWVRHPVYLGYFVNHMGYLLANFGRQNLLVFALLYSFQFVRVLQEEKLLVGNPKYQAYCRKVRWRCLPFIF